MITTEKDETAELFFDDPIEILAWNTVSLSITASIESIQRLPSINNQEFSLEVSKIISDQKYRFHSTQMK